MSDAEGPSAIESADIFEGASLRRNRILARIVDSLLFTPACAAILLGWGVVDLSSSLALVVAALAATWVIVITVWNASRLATHGQTIGKRWMGLRVVRKDNFMPGFVRAFVIRELAWDVLCCIPSWFGFLVGSGVLVALDLVLLWSPDRRCLHDHLAGTRVVPAAQPVWVPVAD